MTDNLESLRAALALHPPGHSSRSSSLNNLAIGLRDRFEQRGVLSDLDEAIELHRDALALYPTGDSAVRYFRPLALHAVHPRVMASCSCTPAPCSLLSILVYH